MKKFLSELGEFGLINVLKKGMRESSSVIKGIDDDTAVLRLSGGKCLLFTTDCIVEGVHFTKDAKPEEIGYKALACNISDIAAMGGVPQHAVVTLGVTGKESVDYIKKIYAGLNRLAKKFEVSIVGGDTVKNANLFINVALTGEAQSKHILYRSGAKVGDKIFVTGPLGNSFKSGHHLSFTPRVKESQFLVKNYKINSMIDISDGLSADLGHIMAQSKVGAELFEEKIPLRKGASSKQALSEGEDFELLFTISSQEAAKLKVSKKHHFFEVGEIVSDGKTWLIDQNSRRRLISNSGYKHF